MPAIPLVYWFAAVAVPVALMPRRGGLAAFGVLAGVFGAASLAIATGASTPASLRGDVLNAIPAWDVVIDAGLFAAAVGLIALGGTLAARARETTSAAAIILLAAAGLGAAVWPVFAVAGAMNTFAAAAALIGLALLAGGGARAIRRFARGDRATPARRGAGTSPARGAGRVVALVGVGATIAAPHLAAVFAGAVAAVLAVDSNARRVRVRTLIVACSLLSLFWAMRTISGPAGLGMASLADAPFSTAAQVGFVVPLALGSWAMMSGWPFHARADGLLVAAGAALLIRVGGALPEGVEHWQAVLVPAGVAALWHAVATGRHAGAIPAGAWIAASVGATAGAWTLAASAAVLALAVAEDGRPQELLCRFAWAGAAVGGALAARPLLGTQVVYGVLAASGVAALLASRERAQPDYVRVAA